MTILPYSKKQAVRLDREWREALRANQPGRREFTDDDLPVWRERAARGLRFASDIGTSAGQIRFDEGEIVPHPQDLCDRLLLAKAVFFGDDVSWCVYAGHEEWDRSEIWESAARTSFA